MRRMSVLFLTMLGVAALAIPAGATSPHFVGTFDVSKSLTTGLTVGGKAAGLGDGPVTAFLTASSVNATYECVNHGGNIAPGQPQVTSDVTGPTQNISPHNGQITFTVTLPPPPTPSSSSECPNGKWSVRLLSLTYYGVVVHVHQGTTDLEANLGTIDP
jgi:hypothetical protein